MNLFKVSALTGNVNVVDVPITKAQIAALSRKEIDFTDLPELTDDHVAFMKTGTIPEEWPGFLKP